MWSEYLEHVKESDIGLTETSNEDVSSVLTFVSLNPNGACVHRSNTL
jgi:hypothetical protein